MNFMWQHYDKLLEFAAKMMSKRKRYYLYDCYDIIHHLFATSKDVENYDQLIKRTLDIVRIGVIASVNKVEHIENTVIQPLDEKYCTKCKKPKYILYEFKPQVVCKYGYEYVYYSQHCRTCHNEQTQIYKKTPKGKEIHKKSAKKYDDNQSKTLSDYYIKKLIYRGHKNKTGVTRSFDSITSQEIALKRQEIINKRAKQIFKGNANG